MDIAKAEGRDVKDLLNSDDWARMNFLILQVQGLLAEKWKQMVWETQRAQGIGRFYDGLGNPREPPWKERGE